MDDLADLRAMVVADRFAQQALWANFLRFVQAEPRTVIELAEESLQAVEATLGHGSNREAVAAIIAHHRSFWDGLHEQFVEQQLPRGE